MQGHKPQKRVVLRGELSIKKHYGPSEIYQSFPQSLLTSSPLLLEPFFPRLKRHLLGNPAFLLSAHVSSGGISRNFPILAMISGLWA